MQILCLSQPNLWPSICNTIEPAKSYNGRAFLKKRKADLIANRIRSVCWHFTGSSGKPAAWLKGNS